MKLLKPTKKNFENLIACGCTDEEIAGRFGFSIVELAALEGSIIQNEPDWRKKMDCRANSLTAIAKEKLRDSLLYELDDPSLEPVNSKYVLDRLSPAYNPKMDITSKGDKVTGFTITPPSPDHEQDN